jgi:membrane protein required for colicin V production
LLWIDYAIVSVIGISAAIGLIRGLVQEAFSLISWGVALWVGFEFSQTVASELTEWIPYPGIRTALAFVVLFSAALVLGKTAGYRIGAWINRTPLGPLNRLGGLVFGGARGLFLVLVLVWLAVAVKLPQRGFWQQSKFLPLLESWVQGQIKGYLRY